MSTPLDRSQPAIFPPGHPAADPYRQLVESVRDHAMIVLDPAGTVKTWNAGAERMMGYTDEEIVGRDFSLLSPAEDRAAGKPQQLLQRSLSECGCEEEGPRLRKDGTPFWAIVITTPLFDHVNNHIGFASITSDLTEQRRHHQALRTADEALQVCAGRFRTLFECAQVGVVLADAKSVYIDANPSACQMLGYSRDEFIGLHASDIVATTEVPHVQAALIEIAADSDHHREWQFRRKDGSAFSADVIATKLPDGTLLGIIRDISDRQQAHDYREHLAALVESSRDAIIGMDLNGVVTSWNAGAAATFGYGADEIIGRSIARLIPDGRREEEDAILADLRRGERVEQLETLRQTKDGRLIDVSVTVSPVRNTSGRIVGASTIARDITAPKEREREVARLSRLYAAMSHVNQAIVWMPNRDELFRKVCRVLVEYGGFCMAWIGWHDPQTDRLVPVAVWGDDSGYLQRITVYTDDRPEGHSPSGTVFRSGRPYVCNDTFNNPATVPWRVDHERSGFRAWAVFPIREMGDVCGTLQVYADKPEFFHDKEMALLEEAGTDLSFALDNFARDQARRQAEQTVRSEKLFSDTMIESMPGIVYFYDAEGRFLRWNQNFGAVSGYSEEEIARMHPRDFFSDEDKPRVEQRIAEVFAKGESSIEASLVAKDGTATPYFFTGRRVLFEGKRCLVGVGIDISDRKRAEDRLVESERKYRELVETANSIILRWNADGRITFLNEFGQRFFGYSSEEIGGRLVTDTIVPPTESGGRDLGRLMENIRAAPEAFEHNVNENMRRNGERIWIAWTNRIVLDSRGQVVEFLSIGTDITERRKLEDQLRQSQKMEAVGRLAGGVAHDFNNLLTIISGYTELLLAVPEVGDTDREAVNAIHEAGARATTLTRQLLGFSRQAMLQPRVLDLNAIVTDTGKMLRRLIGEDVEFTTVLEPNLSRVKVDPGQIDQVLMNLAVNARDAMQKGGKLTIETANVLLSDDQAASHLDCRAGPHVMLSMTDTGCGMAPDVLGHIFEPFFTTKEVDKGTGLGLSMVFGIVQQSGGGIHVCSELGHGTTFRVYFPAVAEELTKKIDPPSKREVQGTETILLVEDEAGVRALASRILQMHGYTVLAAIDGEDALKIAQAHSGPLDLVLTDVVMPNLGGPELAKRLRVRLPHIKVLFMSGYTDDAVVRHGLLEAQVSFIQKPYTPLGLAQRVRQLLDHE